MAVRFSEKYLKQKDLLEKVNLNDVWKWELLIPNGT